MVVAGCVVPRGNEDVSSLCLFFFFFRSRLHFYSLRRHGLEIGTLFD